jgi:hypothetical protein
MAIIEEMKTAWKSCDFCSKSNSDIAETIRDSERWKELPLKYECAWSRICQVGFGRFGKLPIWKALTHYRSNINNMPSYQYEYPSSWLEGPCEIYRALIRPPK